EGQEEDCVNEGDGGGDRRQVFVTASGVKTEPPGSKTKRENLCEWVEMLAEMLKSVKTRFVVRSRVRGAREEPRAKGSRPESETRRNETRSSKLGLYTKRVAERYRSKRDDKGEGGGIWRKQSGRDAEMIETQKRGTSEDVRAAPLPETKGQRGRSDMFKGEAVGNEHGVMMTMNARGAGTRSPSLGAYELFARRSVGVHGDVRRDRWERKRSATPWEVETDI
ncbi:hypothetical protein EDB85DRAFT_1896191, partial [Lactarius pseudohatsudake]